MPRSARLHHLPSLQPTATATSKQADTCCDVMTSPSGPAAMRRPGAHEAAMGEPGRDLLAVVRHQDDRGARRRPRPGVRSRRSRRSRAPRSSPANGSSSRRSSGSLMSARARRTCWRSPSEITPKDRSAIATDAALGEEPVRLLPVRRAVGVPPRLEGAVAATGDDVARRDVGAQLPRHCATDQGDPRAQRAHVDMAQPSPRAPRPAPRSATAAPRPPAAWWSCPSRSARARPSARPDSTCQSIPSSTGTPSRRTVTPRSATAGPSFTPRGDRTQAAGRCAR